jgi:hypothetical protein
MLDLGNVKKKLKSGKTFCLRTERELSDKLTKVCEIENVVPSKLIRLLIHDFISEYEEKNGEIK